ncbi:MAG: spermidine/putrescine ABC transporter substrate-binding protein [Synechococcaceae cyanobacterium]|nr:spermidine/putrescine ABC transporter substrate-binding protein [Synechococcaceae cyanobacterium]
MTLRIRPPVIRRLTRRQLLGQLAVGSAAALLAACGGRRSEGGGRRLAIANWPLNIDASEPGLPGTVDRFEQATGIQVDYSEDINDSQAFFARVRPDLAAGRPIGPDLFITPYWMADRLRGLGWLEPLDLQLIPNRINLSPSLRNPYWDPQGRHTLPWQSGVAGIAYNRRATGREISSIDDLFAPDLHGRVAMLSEMRDTLGLLMLADGQEVSQPTLKTANGAFERLRRGRQSGQIRAFTGNDYMNDLLTGNFKACLAWSGDVAQLARDEPDLQFVVPASGGIRWVDVMAVPRRALHPREAARWMDFVYDPVQAARITAAVQYISPVEGVQARLEGQPQTAALADNPLLFPDAALQRRLHVFGPLDPAEEARFEQRFAEITAA